MLFKQIRNLIKYNYFFAKSEKDEDEKRTTGQSAGESFGQVTEGNVNEENDEEHQRDQSNYAQMYAEWAKKNQTSGPSQSKFSKSFEVSLEDMDNLIDRVDNGIKFKRQANVNGASNKHQSSASPSDRSPQQASPRKKVEETATTATDVVESLRKEWSSMFARLEEDYRSKLDEQQRLNDQKLHSMHEEIKKCLIEQHDRLIEQQRSVATANVQQSTMLNKQQIQDQSSGVSVDKDTSPRVASSEVNAEQHTHMHTQPVQSQANVATATAAMADQAKYISNMRMELKNKHARHVQDLKDYYERELDELKRQLSSYRMRYGDASAGQQSLSAGVDSASSIGDIQAHEQNINLDYKVRYEQLLVDYSNLKSSHEALLNKIVILRFLNTFFVYRTLHSVTLTSRNCKHFLLLLFLFRKRTTTI